MRLRLGLVGDSIAWGQGAAQESERLGPRLAHGLARAGIDTVTKVVAVPGARSADLEAQTGHLLTWSPDVAVVVVGANDLTHRTPVAEAAEALRAAVARLRTVAEVVVAPAPDLSAVPHVPVSLRPAVRAASDRLRTHQLRAVRAAGGSVADADGATATRFHDDPTLFSADRFHPSSTGYAVIAEELLPEVLAAAERVLRGRPPR